MGAVGDPGLAQNCLHVEFRPDNLGVEDGGDFLVQSTCHELLGS